MSKQHFAFLYYTAANFALWEREHYDRNYEEGRYSTAGSILGLEIAAADCCSSFHILNHDTLVVMVAASSSVLEGAQMSADNIFQSYRVMSRFDCYSLSSTHSFYPTIDAQLQPTFYL